MLNRKKISKKQFAEILYYWLTEHLNQNNLKKFAGELNFEINKKNNFNKLFEKVLILNMWLIIYSCEGVLENSEIKNECLDVFHHLVYDRYIIETEYNFKDWMLAISKSYIEYSIAMETEHPSTPLWVVAKVFSEKLYGQINKNPHIHMKIINRIGLFVKHLGKAIKQYSIE